MTGKKIKISLMVFSIMWILYGMASADPPSSTSRAETDVQRSSKLNFDNEIIEGINYGSLSSIESIANLDRRNHIPNYRRKSTFRDEIRKMSKELGYFR